MQAEDLLYDRNGRRRRVYAHITEGYTIRSLIEFLYGTLVDGYIIFDEKGMYLVKGDYENHVINRVRIEDEWLPYYFCNSKEPIKFGLTISNLRTITQSIGKKNGIIFVIYVKSKSLYIQYVGENEGNNENDMGNLKPQRIKGAVFDLEKDEYPSTRVCTAKISGFTAMCSYFLRSNMSFARAKIHPSGVTFTVVSTGKITGKKKSFGIIPKERKKYDDSDDENSDDENEEDENIYYIQKEVVKAMTKLNSLTTANGTFQVYWEANKPYLMFKFPIGVMGKLEIFVRTAEKE